MNQPIFLRGARQLLTLRGPSGPRVDRATRNLEIIEDGSLLIRDNVIEQVGTTRRLENLAQIRDAVEVAVNGMVVMPGFVDPSVTVQAPLKSNGRLSAAAFSKCCSLLLRSSLQYGTLHTQLRVATPEGDLRANLSALRQAAALPGPTQTLTRCWSLVESQVNPEFAAAIPAVSQRKLVHRCDLPASLIKPSSESIWASIRAEKLGVNLVYQGGSHEKLRTALACAQPRMVFCQGPLLDRECALLAECGTPVVVAPARCLIDDIYHGTVQRLVKHRATLAIASGYNEAESPVFNMQMAVALGTLRLGLSIEEAITAATVNAAYAAGVGHLTGSLEVGKRANLLVLDLPDYRELPRHFASNHILLAMRDGKLVVNRSGRKVVLV